MRVMHDTVYEVGQQNKSAWNVVKWINYDPTHYIVRYSGGAYSCSCPAYKICKHIKMIKKFRYTKYNIDGHKGEVPVSIVYNSLGEKLKLTYEEDINAMLKA